VQQGIFGSAYGTNRELSEVRIRLSSTFLLGAASMPRQIKPKYGTDPVQKVPAFSFTNDGIDRLFKALGPVQPDQAEIVA
jgi:hypothetical protein